MFQRSSRVTGSTEKGILYEDIASDYLKKKRFKILERNYRTRFGEIDIICSKGNLIVFVEVKGGKKIPDPFLRVNEEKIRKLHYSINHYLHFSERQWDFIRLDVISITEPDKMITHFKDILS